LPYLPILDVVAYRINYRDSLRSLRLVGVADTLDDARAMRDTVTAAIPQAADRIVIAEDPLLGVASRVVQPPHSLDTAAGLSVLYLGGTLSPDRNWQSRAIAALRSEAVVIANPRRERPVTGDDEALAEIAWRRRHLWRADIGLFWFEGDPVPITLLELGTQLGNPIPMAVGVSPDFACRTRYAPTWATPCLT